jgi:hypothetical protein
MGGAPFYLFVKSHDKPFLLLYKATKFLIDKVRFFFSGRKSSSPSPLPGRPVCRSTVFLSHDDPAALPSFRLPAAGRLPQEEKLPCRPEKSPRNNTYPCISSYYTSANDPSPFHPFSFPEEPGTGLFCQIIRKKPEKRVWHND